MNAPWMHSRVFEVGWLAWIGALSGVVYLTPMPWTLIPLGVALLSMLTILALRYRADVQARGK